MVESEAASALAGRSVDLDDRILILVGRRSRLTLKALGTGGNRHPDAQRRDGDQRDKACPEPVISVAHVGSSPW